MHSHDDRSTFRFVGRCPPICIIRLAQLPSHLFLSLSYTQDVHLSYSSSLCSRKTYSSSISLLLENAREDSCWRTSSGCSSSSCSSGYNHKPSPSTWWEEDDPRMDRVYKNAWFDLDLYRAIIAIVSRYIISRHLVFKNVAPAGLDFARTLKD